MNVAGEYKHNFTPSASENKLKKKNNRKGADRTSINSSPDDWVIKEIKINRM